MNSGFSSAFKLQSVRSIKARVRGARRSATIWRWGGGEGHVICHGYDSSQPCIRSATIHSLDFFLQSHTDFTTAKIHDCYLSMEISNEWLLGGIESLSTLHQVGQIGRRNYQTR